MNNTVELSSKTIIVYQVSYDGTDIKCDVTMVNDKLKQVRFHNERYENLVYLTPDNVEYITNVPFHKIDNSNFPTFKTLTEVEKFDLFDSLYYVGGVQDGMFAKPNGDFIATKFNVDDIHASIYLGIETTKKRCEEILADCDKSFLSDIKIVEKPSYNWDTDCEDHYTITCMIKPPQELYTKALKGKKYLENQAMVMICEEIGLYNK